MNRLLELLKDGHARTTLMLASELNTTPEDIGRKLEYLENAGIIRKVPTAVSCSGCSLKSSCKKTGTPASYKECHSCMPGPDILNMGEMWEVIR